jgi:hypothetical protein
LDLRHDTPETFKDAPQSIIQVVPIMGTMSFIRKKTRKGKDGATKDYYYLVENLYEDGKVRQKVIKYLGTSPNRREIPIDPSLAGQVASTLMSGKLKPAEMKDAVEKMGISLGPGKLKSISLRFYPPLGKLTLVID